MSDLAETARRLIARHGAPVTLLSIAPGVYDTVTQRNVAPAPKRTETRGVIAEGDDTRDARQQAGMRRFYLAGYSASPKIDDRIEFAGVAYTIAESLPVYIRGIVALYDVRAVKA